MTMHHRNVRVDDEVWERAGKRAADEDTNLSTLIRAWLTDYAAGGEANAERAKIRVTVAEAEAVREALAILDIGGVVVDAVNKER